MGMKKRIYVVLAIVLALLPLLSGCADRELIDADPTAAPEAVTGDAEILQDEPDAYDHKANRYIFQTAKQNGGSFSQAGDTIYYVSQGVLYAYDTQNHTAAPLYTDEHLSGVYASGGGVFFLTDNGGDLQKNYEFDLFELLPAGDFRHVFSSLAFPRDEYGELEDKNADIPPRTVQANDAYVLVACHAETYLVRRDSGEIVSKDYNNFNTYVVDGSGGFYFTDPKGAQSIWKLDPESSEYSLCRGDGIGRRDKPDGAIRYEYVYSIDGALYASTRVPSAVWKLNDGGGDLCVFKPENDDRILDFLVLPGKDCVYVVYAADNTALNIYKISTANNEILAYELVPAKELRGGKMAIVDDSVYYMNGDTPESRALFQN